MTDQLSLLPDLDRASDTNSPVVDGRRNNFEALDKPNLMDAVNGNATENVTASKDVTLESSTSMRKLLNNGEMNKWRHTLPNTQIALYRFLRSF